MSAPLTQSQQRDLIAERIQHLFPEDAATLRSFRVPGAKRRRDKHGLSPNDYALARLWLEMRERIARGEFEGDVLADTEKNRNIPYDQLARLLDLDGYSRVRRAIKIIQGGGGQN